MVRSNVLLLTSDQHFSFTAYHITLIDSKTIQIIQSYSSIKGPNSKNML